MLQHWTDYFDSLGLPYEAIESNTSAVSLPAIAGAPVLRVVKNQQELSELHQVAKEKSEAMGRILMLALPFTNPGCIATLPGEMVMPKVRAYAGQIASTFSLSGHRIESSLLVELKKETQRIIAKGTKEKTPLLDWLLQLAGGSWVYGKPSSLSQLDSLLGLVCRDPNLIGHVRTRQLSFGRGCSDALLLPINTVELRSHRLEQKVSPADWRLISLEQELTTTAKGRDRVHAMVSNCFLTTVNKHNPKYAVAYGAGQILGGSVLGKAPAVAEPVASTEAVTNQVMAEV